MINPKGELFTTAWTFGGSAAIKLLSSIILTRLLYPEAFGMITILFSVIFMFEMLGDIGVFGLLVRHEKGDQPSFTHTLWTIRLIRSCINAVALYFAAPLIAQLYELPELAPTLEVFAPWFVLAGLESMSMMLAVRRKNTKIVNFTTLAATAISSACAITYSYFQQDHMGMVYAALLDRLFVTTVSYFVYTEYRPRFRLDRTVSSALFDFAKYVMPSSLMTLVIVQYDKIIFLRLFSLELLGIYGLAANIASQLEGLLAKVCSNILYPRCAENYRDDPNTFVEKFYVDNLKLHAFLLVLPAILFGFAQVLTDVLYDERYVVSGYVLHLFAVRVMLSTVATTSQDILFAAGHIRIQFWGNIIRLVWFVPGVLVGYWLFGFNGFVGMVTLEYLPTAVYYFHVQRKQKLMIAKYELLRLAVFMVCATAAFVVALALDYANVAAHF